MPETELEFLNDANAALSQAIDGPVPGDPWGTIKALAGDVRERILTVEASQVDVRARYAVGSDAAIQRSLDTPYPIAGLAGRPVRDILVEVNAALKATGIEEEESWFSEANWHLPDDQRVWPADHRWVLCFAVRGTNEGYYAHIMTFTQIGQPAPGTVRFIAMAKCNTWATAQAMASAAGHLFEGPLSWKLWQ